VLTARNFLTIIVDEKNQSTSKQNRSEMRKGKVFKLNLGAFPEKVIEKFSHVVSKLKMLMKLFYHKFSKNAIVIYKKAPQGGAFPYFTS
jgi:hypothetical protein